MWMLQKATKIIAAISWGPTVHSDCSFEKVAHLILTQTQEVNATPATEIKYLSSVTYSFQNPITYHDPSLPPFQDQPQL